MWKNQPFPDTSPRHCRNSSTPVCVRILYGNSLIFICKVPDRHVPFLFVPVTIILTFVRLQHISLLLLSVFHLLFLTYPLLFQALCLSVFHLPSPIRTLISHCLFLSSVFSSYVPLFHFYYYLSTICPLFLAFPFWPWQLNIPSLVTLWVIFYILCTTPFSILLWAM